MIQYLPLQMDAEPQSKDQQCKCLSSWLAFAVGMVLLFVGWFIWYVARWTDLREALLAGLINGVALTVATGVYYIPWCVIVGFCCRSRWKRWRAKLILTPPLLLVAYLSLPLLGGLPGPESTFPRLMKVSLPRDVKSMRYYSRGGGITDSAVVYCFETSPTEVGKLIREMGFQCKRDWSAKDAQSFPFWPFPDAPDLQRWKGGVYYEHRERNSFRYLIIDKERRLVYAAYSTI